MHVLGPGGIVAAFAFGFRHGVDWDHLAALGDITGTEPQPRRAMRLAAGYVLGHATVILLLGGAAILFADHLPAGIDGVMEKVVGATLVVLGAVLLQSVVRHWDQPRLRSRWMALGEALHRVGHRRVPPPDDATRGYGLGAAIGVGMVHGIGAETPTQLLLFAGVAAGGGDATSVLVLASFVVGLVVANTVIAAGGALGFRRVQHRPRLARAVSLCTGVFSIALGLLLVTGSGAVLPPLLGG